MTIRLIIVDFISLFRQNSDIMLNYHFNVEVQTIVLGHKLTMYVSISYL